MSDRNCLRCGAWGTHVKGCPATLLPSLVALREAGAALVSAAEEYQSAANRHQVDVGAARRPTAETHAELWEAFHKLWTRDASSAALPVNLMIGNGYNKEEWMNLERLIEAAINGAP